MKSDKYLEALQIIERFRHDPQDYIETVNNEKSIPNSLVIRSQHYLKGQLKKLDRIEVKAADVLSYRLDKLNEQIYRKTQTQMHFSDFDTVFLMEAIDRIGIYIPKRMPSSAYTYLSAAKAAGVKSILLFVAQDEKGDVDPLTIYVAEKYKAELVSGPARIAFPLLAFGLNGVEKCDMICGPCGASMNILKTLCGLMAGVAIDMSAGPSDLSIITDTNSDWDQIYFDLLSQLEHGEDSSSQLLIVGLFSKYSFENSLAFEEIKKQDRIEIVYVDNPANVHRVIYSRSPETLEIFSDNPEKFKSCFKFCGVVYLNTSSTLGDYGVIGRGCADPTGGLAKAQSGISPLKFLKTTPIVSKSLTDETALASALRLSHYEKLNSHSKVIDFIIKNKKIQQS